MTSCGLALHLLLLLLLMLLLLLLLLLLLQLLALQLGLLQRPSSQAYITGALTSGTCKSLLTKPTAFVGMLLHFFLHPTACPARTAPAAHSWPT